MKEQKLAPVLDLEVNLLLSPPAIKETAIENIDFDLTPETQPIYLAYKNASISEGRLNIFISQFDSLKYHIHVYGKIKGKELQFEREVNGTVTNSLGIQNMRIKFILINSRNILRNYYLNSNIKSIEDHLTSFLIPI